MGKILSPISRWQFFLAMFIVNSLFSLASYHLITQCGIFLQNDFIFSNPLLLSLIWFSLSAIIIIYLCYKRLLDIYGSSKKAIGAILFITICWLIAFFVLMKPIYYLFNTNNLDNFAQFQSDTTNQLCYRILYIIFFIYLTFKKGSLTVDKLNIKTLFKRICLLIFICFVFQSTNKLSSLFVFLPAQDMKMQQTIDFSDTFLSYKHFKHESLKRFDVVTVRDENLDLYNTPIRIIGLPNEKIEIKNNEIYVDNKLIEDKFGFYAEKLTPLSTNKTITLDNNSYFLMGDNRNWQKGAKYLTKNKKTGKETWYDINDEISFVVSKDKITGKIIAINYKDYSKNKKYENRQKRNKTGIVILSKDRTLELNPSPISVDLYGENKKR